MKEDWTKKLRQKLEGHRMAPPAGLWEGISEQMEQQAAGFATAKPKPARTVANRWWRWAAAAVILALVGFFALQHSEEPLQQPLQTTLRTQRGQAPLCPDAPSVAEKPLVAMAESRSQNLASAPPVQPAAVDQPAPATTETEEALPDSPDSPASPQPADHTEWRAERPDDPSAENTQPAKTKQSINSPLSLGITASSGLLAAMSSQHASGSGGVPRYQDSNLGGFVPAASSFEGTLHQVGVVADHHLPVRFGLTLRYQLNQRIALMSGVNYTYLFSRFSIPRYENAVFDQKLRYLGVPLSLAWQFWRTSHLRFYVSGGAMLEKCISTHSELPDRPNDKPWQWSLDAAAGAEYDFTPQFGFYLEPSLGYYFDDGTPLEHYYKEHPLAPSFEFGLRFNVK